MEKTPSEGKNKLDKLNLLLQQTALYSTFLSKQIAEGTNHYDEEIKLEENYDKPEQDTKKRKRKPKTKKNNESLSEKLASVPESNKKAKMTQPELCSGGVMRSYQLKGVNWLIQLFENGLNGILADEMGLGKTVVTIGLFAHLWAKGVKGPFLVVAPLSTLGNWVNEVKKWTPEIPVILYHGTQEERLEKRISLGVEVQKGKKKKRKIEQKFYPIVVTSYEIAINDRKYLQKLNWKYLVVDEAHRLKNFNCKLIVQLRILKTENRLLLTGTPLQNNLTELWSLLNFILPNIFDDLTSFQSWFDFTEVLEAHHNPEENEDYKPEENGKQKKKKEEEKNENEDENSKGKEKEENENKNGEEDDIEDMELEEKKPKILTEEDKIEDYQDSEHTKLVTKLHDILRPFLLRRLKSDVDLGIPKKGEIVLYSGFQENQKNFYHFIKNREFKQAKLNFNNVLMQLRKICNHPFLFDHEVTNPILFPKDHKNSKEIVSLLNSESEQIEDHSLYVEALVKSCGKMELLDRMLPILRADGHKILIFSQMTKMLDLLEEYFDCKGLGWCRIDGNVAQSDRQDQIDSFNNDDDKFVFLLSTRAGGVGINLTGADTVIIYDSDWNPQVDLQAQDRCHRIGQTKPVCIYRLITANSVESRILARAKSKLKLSHLVIKKGNFKEKDKNTVITDGDVKEILKLEIADGTLGRESEGIISQEDLLKVLDREKCLKMLEENLKLENSNGDILQGKDIETLENADHDGFVFLEEFEAEF